MEGSFAIAAFHTRRVVYCWCHYRRSFWRFVSQTDVALQEDELAWKELEDLKRGMNLQVEEGKNGAKPAGR